MIFNVMGTETMDCNCSLYSSLIKRDNCLCGELNPPYEKKRTCVLSMFPAPGQLGGEEVFPQIIPPITSLFCTSLIAIFFCCAYNVNPLAPNKPCSSPVVTKKTIVWL